MKKIFIKILFTLFILLPAPCVSASATAASTVGDFKVEVLVDFTMEGSSELLKNADSKALETYLPSGKFPLPVNSVLVRDDKRIILVDSGLGKNLRQQLKDRNISPDQVEIILLTHMHFDHIDGLMHDGQVVFPKAKLYIAQNEAEYWATNEKMETRPQEEREGFVKAQAVLAAYKDRIITFSPADLKNEIKELLPGVSAIAAYGHTPGHTVFLLQSKGKKLMLLGDTFHVEAIQFPRPEVTMIFDVDQVEAAKTRKTIFDYVQKHQIPISGSHLNAPQYRRLEKNKAEPGGYLSKELSSQ